MNNVEREVGERKSKVCDCEGQHQGIVVPEAYQHGVRFGQTNFLFLQDGHR